MNMTDDMSNLDYAANKMTRCLSNNLIMTKKDFTNIQSPQEKLSFLTDKLNCVQKELQKQTSILEKVQYENKKLNAQIEVQNKIIDSQNEELISLRGTNTKLEIINKTLIKNNEHYWRNTFAISFIVAIISFILGHIF